MDNLDSVKKTKIDLSDYKINKTIPIALLFFLFSTFVSLALNIIDKNIFSAVLVNEAMAFVFFVPNLRDNKASVYVEYTLKFLVPIILLLASIFIFNANIYSILFTIICDALLFGYLLIMQNIKDWALAIVSPIYFLFVAEFLNGNAVSFLNNCFVTKPTIIFTLTLLFIWALYNIIATPFKTRRVSYLIVAFIVFIFGFLNKFTLICTQKTFAFSNIKEIWEAMKVTGFDTYKKYVPIWLIVIGIIIVYSLIVNFVLEKEKNVNVVIRLISCAIALIIILVYCLLIKSNAGNDIYGTIFFDIFKPLFLRG